MTRPAADRRLIAAALSLSAPLALIACEQPPQANDEPLAQSWSALMDDGDVTTIAPGAAMRMPLATPAPLLPRFCPGVTPPDDTSGNFGDCARAPLAFWTLDDCQPFSTIFNDSAFTSQIFHPAFRAVSAACVAGASGQAVRLAVADDVVYAPDQPDFVFDRGLTIAAWINPERFDGVQTIARKRLDGTSSFLLALDGRTLVFVVRLGNGRLAAATFNKIRAGRFTHVAATYDGTNAVLYADGVEVDRARARGTLAAGAGPIFVGNDANGRRLRGVVDEIWLNTLAAPADQIAELTCIRQAPLARFTPETSPPTPLGTTVAFDLAITNQSSALCPAENFDFFPANIPSGLTADPFFGVVTAAPGETAHATINVTVAVGTQPIPQTFSYQVIGERGGASGTTAAATYVVAPPATPTSCTGSPPATPRIIGAPLSPTGAQASYTFAAPGLAVPVVTPIFNPDGSTQGLQISATPGTSTDPANAFLGFGMGFFNPPCLDASAYNAVRFTVSGDLGTCALVGSLVPSNDNSTVNGGFGFCTAGSACFPPQSGPLTTGVNVVHFADMTGGSPVPTLNAAGLNAVQWVLNVPTDGVTAPCVANFTVSDVSFINDSLPPPHALNFTFDSDLQGWGFNTFDEPRNFVVHPAAGVRPPAISFQPGDGDPAPGSASVAVSFTAFDQYVDPIINLPFPGLDLSGTTLHARVRLVTGSLPDSGGVLFHASSGFDFAFAAAPFILTGALTPGVWVPIEFDLAHPDFTSPTFDPAQIVQVGIQVTSGFDLGAPFTGGPVVLQIDTITD